MGPLPNLFEQSEEKKNDKGVSHHGFRINISFSDLKEERFIDNIPRPEYDNELIQPEISISYIFGVNW